MNALSRRGFLHAAAVSSAGALLASAPLVALQAKEPKAKLAAQDLGGGFWLITGGASNTLVFASPEGPLLIDGGAASQSKALLKLALQAANAKKVHTLVNTHWHPEQVGSNETLGKQGVRIIAHENTRLWLTRKNVVDWSPAPLPALPKIAQPNQSFYTTEKVAFGGEDIALGHLGQAHTDGDLYAWFPKANILAAGGVLSSSSWPLMDWQSGGWIGGLVGAHDRLLKIANDTTRIIPANGVVMGRKELQAQRDMYFQIFDRLVKQLIKSMGPDEAYESGPAKEYEAQFGDSKPFVLASFRSLWGHYAPDA